MSIWQFLDGIIRHPPVIIVTILIAIVVAHALKLAFEFITHRPQPNSLIIILELFVVIILGYAAIHGYLEIPIDGAESTSGHNPFWIACLLVFFTLVSIVLYIFYRAAIRNHNEE
jgi:hypothetical protein